MTERRAETLILNRSRRDPVQVDTSKGALPAAVAAQLLDGLASDLPARLLIELQLLGADVHPAECLRERVAHQFGAGHCQPSINIH